MSTGEYASLPEIHTPISDCLDTSHNPHGCQGCTNCLAIKGVKKPWYMTAKPVENVSLSMPEPILLMKVESWVLEKWAEDETESNVSHYCTTLQWKKHMGIEEIRGGYCEDCHEEVPVEMVGAWTMHNWSHLQEYDKDMEKYAKYATDDPTATSSDLKVYS